MGTQETGLRDHVDIADTPIAASGMSLVVDQPSPPGSACSVLILPFAAPSDEAALGRQIGVVVERSLRSFPDLTVGHGLLVATSGHERRYLSLARPLSAEQALTCGASWGATAVLYGAISVRDGVRWSIVLQRVASREMLFDDTLIGDLEDLLDAPVSVAHAVAQSLGLDVEEGSQIELDYRETRVPDALLSYLAALDMRPQHGITPADAGTMRIGLLRAFLLDPTFAAPVEALIEDLIAAPDATGEIEDLLDRLAAEGDRADPALIQLAHAIAEHGQPALAQLVVSAVLGRDPLQVDALEQAARYAYAAGQFARARTLVQSLLDLQPDHADAHELLGNLLAAGGRYPGAAIHWELALDHHPGRLKLLMRLGTYHAVAGDYARAHDLLQRIVAADTIGVDALYHLGLAAYRLGRYEDAAGALERCLLREPGRAAAEALLARALIRLGRAVDALLHDARAVMLSPTLWPSLLALATSALRDGDVERAVEIYGAVTRIRPDLPEALQGLGMALVAGGMLRDGAAALTRAHELQPKEATVLCALALTQAQLRDMPAATRSIDAAAALAPESAAVARCRAALALLR